MQQNHHHHHGAAAGGLNAYSGSHVTVNATSGSNSRRNSFGRKFGRRLTQAFTGFTNKRHSATSSSHGKNQKATKTLGVIMGCFILCWLPFFILAIAKPIALNIFEYKLEEVIPNWCWSLLLWLGYFNSALNPMIYARYNREFRRPFLEILCFRLAFKEINCFISLKRMDCIILKYSK